MDSAGHAGKRLGTGGSLTPRGLKTNGCALLDPGARLLECEWAKVPPVTGGCICWGPSDPGAACVKGLEEAEATVRGGRTGTGREVGSARPHVRGGTTLGPELCLTPPPAPLRTHGSAQGGGPAQTLVLDGAHTPESAEALVVALR